MLTLKRDSSERSLTINHDIAGDIRLTLPPDLPADDFDVDHPDNKEVVSAAMLLHFVWMFLYSVGSDDIEGSALGATGIVETLDYILKDTTSTT